MFLSTINALKLGKGKFDQCTKVSEMLQQQQQRAMLFFFENGASSPSKPLTPSVHPSAYLGWP
jgi:hypothetical protein